MKIDDVMMNLKRNGYKLTEQRKEIVESIYRNIKYISAKDIFINVQKKYPRVSLDTIYRNLNTLVDLGLIEEKQFDGEAKYKAPCVSGHHHHLICNICGGITTTEKCPMDFFLGDYEENFEIINHKFEVYGICKECQDNYKQRIT